MHRTRDDRGDELADLLRDALLASARFDGDRLEFIAVSAAARKGSRDGRLRLLSSATDRGRSANRIAVFL
jgi:hypothetical protein